MHIKQVIVQGFRSYRDQTTVEPFDKGHNVIVGRNGSGKSNFFYAIQFVLSDEFSHMRSEQRQALLHEGTGPRVVQAYVEIIFDNSDSRLPIEKEEVAIQRVIGAKKDQYFIDKKAATKAEVMSLLEAAGFSKSNPYYIVKQGKINELATSPDSLRLKLLREVAGTRVYDDRKEESQLTMKETDSKREKIDNLLKYIDDRLTTLEEETKELKEFQKLDKMRRSLEWTIYDQELKDCRRKLDELAEKREVASAQSSQLYDQLHKITDELKKTEKLHRDYTNSTISLKEQRDMLTEQNSTSFQQKTKLELQIRDLREAVEGERNSQSRAETELQKLQKEINTRETRLEEIQPKFEEANAREKQSVQELALTEQRQKELNAKLGRKQRFSTKQERDQYLNGEITTINRHIKGHEEQITKLKKELAADDLRATKLDGEVGEAMQEMETQRGRIESNKKELGELKSKRERLYNERLEINRLEAQAEQEISQTNDELRMTENSLRGMIGRGMMQGIESVNKIMEQMREKGQQQDVIRGYHGLLIDLFRTEQNFYTAVEVTAGGKLFYHVVDTDRVAQKLLNEQSRQKLPGEINFMPLNRLNAEEAEYPDDPSHVVPMIQKLEFEDQYMKAFQFTFSKTLICRNMDVCTRYAKSSRLNCITLEGDKVDHRGTLTGGYRDQHTSRLRMHASKQELQQRLRAKKAELQQHRERQYQLSGEMTQIENDVSKMDMKINKMKESYESLGSARRSKLDELNLIKEQRPVKDRTLGNLVANLEQLQAHAHGLQQELGTDLLSQLTAEEQAEFSRLDDQIAALRSRVEFEFRERSKYEKEKNQLENLLKTNLYKKRDEFKTKRLDRNVDEQRTDLESFQQQMEIHNRNITDTSKQLAAVEKQLDEGLERLRDLEVDLEKWQNEERELTSRLTDEQKEGEKLQNKLTMNTKKKEDCMKKMRELGLLPSDAFDKYQNMPQKKLYSMLEKCNKDLKQFENVNKKALDQFVTFSEQKEKLGKRLEELDAGKKSIEDLINVLDQRKYDAIELTFKQVSKYFVDVFKKLVPGGQAQLIMRKGDEGHTEEDSSIPKVEQFTGIGIKVSFVGTSETKEMQQLSGGQKSLVALALIFAIQKCDPAPFYLFDEIDAALDQQHRRAVAEMIHELSRSAQFITTTFRPELLENADKYYGVRFRNKVSHIDCVSKEEARDFVEDDQTHT